MGNHQDDKNGLFVMMCVLGIGLVFISWVGFSFYQHTQEKKAEEAKLAEMRRQADETLREVERSRKEQNDKIIARTAELRQLASVFVFGANPVENMIFCMNLMTHDSLRVSHGMAEGVSDYWRSLEKCPETATNAKPVAAELQE